MLDEVLIPQFTHRLLPVDPAAARRWGERTAAARGNGTPVGAIDALIAAMAAQHGLAVATRNVRDFEHLAVDVVDPWMEARPWRAKVRRAPRGHRPTALRNLPSAASRDGRVCGFTDLLRIVLEDPELLVMKCPRERALRCDPQFG